VSYKKVFISRYKIYNWS